MKNIEVSRNSANNYELVNYTDFIQQLCKHLFKITGINHFSYVEMNEQGQFFWLGSNGDYLEKCINSQLVDNAPVSILKTYPKTGIYLIDVYQEEYKQHSLPVFELLNHFNYGHSFRMLEIVNNQRFKLYSFDAPLEKQDINHVYLNNLEVFKKFNSYFDEKISSIKNKLLKRQIDSNNHTECICLINKFLESDFLKPIFQGDFYTEDQYIQLTPREKEILSWFVKGKTSEETACLLSISRRTVERHFENLRDKFSCFSKNQLALKLRDLLENP